MGTRNITRIRVGGELKACQYGQWDGYPTSAGRHILEFVAGCDAAAFAEKAARCTLENTTGDTRGDKYYTGAPATERTGEVFDAEEGLMYGENRLRREDYGGYDGLCEEVGRRLLERFGADVYAEYLVATRDTGYQILDVIAEYGPLTLYYDDYFLIDECDWQIEAINEVDLDARVVRLNFHNHCREYTFGEVRAMDIGAEMEGFENEAYAGESGAA